VRDNLEEHGTEAWRVAHARPEIAAQSSGQDCALIGLEESIHWFRAAFESVSNPWSCWLLELAEITQLADHNRSVAQHLV
jgi:hypothetical protein